MAEASIRNVVPRPGKTYKVRLAKGGWKTFKCEDVIYAGKAMTATQVMDYYGLGQEKKKTIKAYMRPIRSCDRYVFAIPRDLVKALGIRGARYMVICSSFNPSMRKA